MTPLDADGIPRITISGGRPTDAEVAAVTAALLGLTAHRPETTTAAIPGWMAAVRLEAVGGAPAASAADPRLSGRWPTRR